jgi:hypothetical protein
MMLLLLGFGLISTLHCNAFKNYIQDWKEFASNIPLFCLFSGIQIFVRVPPDVIIFSVVPLKVYNSSYTQSITCI